MTTLSCMPVTSPKSPVISNQSLLPTGDSIQPMPVRYACPECDETFSLERMRNLHVRIQHERLPCHKCPHCMGPFGRLRDLNKHILEKHRGQQRRQHKCNECSCSFASQVTLRHHVEKAHRREVLTCQYCGFGTVHEGVLKRHCVEHHKEKMEIKEIEEPTEPSLVVTEALWHGEKRAVEHIEAPEKV